jgi:hypothetical protein
LLIESKWKDHFIGKRHIGGRSLKKTYNEYKLKIAFLLLFAISVLIYSGVSNPNGEIAEFTRLINIPLDARKSFFLFGPRGTGKATWLKHHLPDALFLNLLQSEPYNHLTAKPGLLRKMIPPGYKASWYALWIFTFTVFFLKITL